MENAEKEHTGMQTKNLMAMKIILAQLIDMQMYSYDDGYHGDRIPQADEEHSSYTK